MRVSRQRLCCVGLFLGILSAPASGQPQRLSARDAEDSRHHRSAPGEVRKENGVANNRSLERRDDRTSNEISGDGEFRIFFVPTGEDPREYPEGPTIFDASALRGHEVPFEIFIQNAPVPVRGITAGIPCKLGGGASGSIDYAPFSAVRDSARPDYVFFQSPGDYGSPDATRCPDEFLRFSCGLNAGTVNLSEPKYFAEFALSISLDAEGTFTLTFLAPPTRIVDNFSEPIPGLLIDQLVLETGCAPVPCVDVADCICPHDAACNRQRCFSSTCIYVPKKFGDVNADGLVDVSDILCALDGFTGSFDRCSFADVDISGCQADGVIDILDILAVLDAFEGVELCNRWCGPPGGP